MDDAKKMYAIGAGIAAALLVLALALAVLSSSKQAAPALKQVTRTQQVRPRASNNHVKAVVRTPDTNTVSQSVTVKR